MILEDPRKHDIKADNAKKKEREKERKTDICVCFSAARQEHDASYHYTDTASIQSTSYCFIINSWPCVTTAEFS